MTIDVLDPTGRRPQQQPGASATIAPRLHRLDDGRPVAFLDNLKPGASSLLGALRSRIEDTYRVPTVYWEKTGPKGSSGAMELGEKLEDQVGAVINALGD
jgi:hypothetical protein